MLPSPCSWGTCFADYSIMPQSQLHFLPFSIMQTPFPNLHSLYGHTPTSTGSPKIEIYMHPPLHQLTIHSCPPFIFKSTTAPPFRWNLCLLASPICLPIQEKKTPLFCYTTHWSLQTKCFPCIAGRMAADVNFTRKRGGSAFKDDQGAPERHHYFYAREKFLKGKDLIFFDFAGCSFWLSLHM